MESLAVGIILAAFGLYLFAWPLSDVEKTMPDIKEEYMDDR